eukprot:gb/GEZN01004122.1/.p1 GENE.gb/GEZN01004122.1/~~gb/GEZN01004122.1/.p1  ORF type:complete len:503 (+),score=65.53 gb/GEZN01004122.1/:104-1510(+)
MSTITLNADLTVICFRREKTKAGPWFVVREFDTKVIRAKDKNAPKGRGPSEQAIRASIRQAILNMGLKSERASKSEIRLLKADGILGKRAPSCSLLNAEDMIRLLRAFGKNDCARDLHQAMIENRKNFPGMQLETLAQADEPARKHIKVAGGKRLPAFSADVLEGCTPQSGPPVKRHRKKTLSISGLDALLSAVEQAGKRSDSSKNEQLERDDGPYTDYDDEDEDSGDETYPEDEAVAAMVPPAHFRQRSSSPEAERQDDDESHLHPLPSPSPRSSDMHAHTYSFTSPHVKSVHTPKAQPWSPNAFTTPMLFRPRPGSQGAGAMRPSQLIMGVQSPLPKMLPAHTPREDDQYYGDRKGQFSHLSSYSRADSSTVNLYTQLRTQAEYATPTSRDSPAGLGRCSSTPPPPLTVPRESLSSPSPSSPSPPVSPRRNSPPPQPVLFEDHTMRYDDDVTVARLLSLTPVQTER